ncbi:MAG: hypothetical protein ACK4QL_00105 [Pseudanabaenaceae cyanobacterium]
MDWKILAVISLWLVMPDGSEPVLDLLEYVLDIVPLLPPYIAPSKSKEMLKPAKLGRW